MSVSGAAQPAPDPGSQPRPKPSPRPIGWTGTAPTPLDALFILLASLFLLLLLLWIATVLNGNEKFTHLPTWFTDAIQGIWSKVILGAGTAGTLALRKWLYKTTPSPNYLLWIAGFTVFFGVAVFGAKHLLPQAPASPMTHFHVPVRFSVEGSQAGAVQTENEKVVWFKKRLPLPQENPVGLMPASDKQPNVYRHYIDVPDSSSTGFEAELNHATLVSHADGTNPRAAEYLLCLHTNAEKPLPADASSSNTALIQIECLNSGVCKPASGDPGYVADCGAPMARKSSLLPVVYAATAEKGREPGWVVPSLDTLDKMADRERVGYTRFYVSFNPTGVAAAADHYFYILRVNDKPIYIDGFLPDRTVYPLQRGTTNWISFALENLNFSGQNAGKEKLHLTVVFLQGQKEVYRQDVEREYVALRDAADIPPINTDVGEFRWTGKYVVPKNENKYELFLGSSAKPDLAMNAKAQFEKLKLSIDSQPAVLVVRPPLGNNPSYGMVIGLVMPTSQVQFTFDDEGSHKLCHWAAENAGTGPAGRIVLKGYYRYDIGGSKAVPCN